MGNEAQAEIDSLRERLAAAEAVAAEVARNALLELQNEKMRRTLFGQRSERTRHLLDQMDLTFEERGTAASEDELLATLAAAKTNVGEPGLRIEVVELRRTDEAKHEGRALAHLGLNR